MQEEVVHLLIKLLTSFVLAWDEFCAVLFYLLFAFELGVFIAVTKLVKFIKRRFFILWWCSSFLHQSRSQKSINMFTSYMLIYMTWYDVQAFGPIMPIMKFSSDEEVVDLANDSKYGLGCAVFSGSQRRAKRIASLLHCGVAAINDFASNYMCQVLFVFKWQ